MASEGEPVAVASPMTDEYRLWIAGLDRGTAMEPMVEPYVTRKTHGWYDLAMCRMPAVQRRTHAVLYGVPGLIWTVASYYDAVILIVVGKPLWPTINRLCSALGNVTVTLNYGYTRICVLNTQTKYLIINYSFASLDEYARLMPPIVHGLWLGDHWICGPALAVPDSDFPTELTGYLSSAALAYAFAAWGEFTVGNFGPTETGFMGSGGRVYYLPQGILHNHLTANLNDASHDHLLDSLSPAPTLPPPEWPLECTRITCAICNAAFPPDNAATAVGELRLRCGHTVHLNCALYESRFNKCPACRTRLTDNSVPDEYEEFYP